MTRGRPILDYSVDKDDAEGLVFKPMYIEQSLLLIFKLVRADGNKTVDVICINHIIMYYT